MTRPYEKLIAWQEAYTKKDKSNFLDIALGSLEELHCQFRIATGLGYIGKRIFEKSDNHIHRISYLINKLKSSLI